MGQLRLCSFTTSRGKLAQFDQGRGSNLGFSGPQLRNAKEAAMGDSYTAHLDPKPAQHHTLDSDVLGAKKIKIVGQGMKVAIAGRSYTR